MNNVCKEKQPINMIWREKSGISILRFKSGTCCYLWSSYLLHVQMLRWGLNSRQLHRTKHFPSTNWTYSDTGFYSGQTSYLNMKMLKMQVSNFLNHCCLRKI